MRLAHVGVDVGGTKILAVACNVTTGEVYNRTKIETPSGKTNLIASIRSAIKVVQNGSELATVGIGLPGLVDRSGVLRHSPHVSTETPLNLAEDLQPHVGVPVAVANDAACAVVAEHRLGAGTGYDDVVMITQGTGIGGGIIVNGKLVHGSNGFAAEPGHIKMTDTGRQCACGQRGCWETTASGTGLAVAARELAATRGGLLAELVDGELDHIRGEHVSAAMATGDPVAVDVVKKFVASTAAGLATIVHLLDPQIIILGGGLTSLTKEFVDEVRCWIPQLLMGGTDRPPTPVVVAELGEVAGALGAALLGYHDY